MFSIPAIVLSIICMHPVDWMHVTAVYAGLLLHKREGREIEWAINVNVKRA